MDLAGSSLRQPEIIVLVQTFPANPTKELTFVLPSSYMYMANSICLFVYDLCLLSQVSDRLWVGNPGPPLAVEADKIL